MVVLRAVLTVHMIQTGFWFLFSFIFCGLFTFCDHLHLRCRTGRKTAWKRNRGLCTDSMKCHWAGFALAQWIIWFALYLHRFVGVFFSHNFICVEPILIILWHKEFETIWHNEITSLKKFIISLFFLFCYRKIKLYYRTSIIIIVSPRSVWLNRNEFLTLTLSPYSLVLLRLFLTIFVPWNKLIIVLCFSK